MTGKLTRMVQDRVHPDRVNLYVDGEYAGYTTLELIYRFQLRTGMSLTPELQQEIRAAEELEQAKTIALKYLQRRNRSGAEMRQYLERKGIREDHIPVVLQFLMDRNLINDASYAQLFVNQRLLYKPRGRKMIRFELSQRGISSADIDNALIGAEISEAAAAYQLVQKRMRSVSGTPTAEWIDKTCRWLMAKGFSYSVARNAVDQAVNNSVDDEL